MQGSAGSVPRAPQRRQRSRQAPAGGRPWTLPSLKRALGGQRSASEGSSTLSSALAAAAQGDGDGDEVLDTIYANWGTLQGREDAGACLLQCSHSDQRPDETIWL